ncbi:hypothetical protein BH23GEM9_BH23GEM9_20010 [soil metagenome]
MSKPILIPGDILTNIFDRVRDTGEPLLRGERDDDRYFIEAKPASGGEYDLVLGLRGMEHPDEELSMIQTWSDMAHFLGTSVGGLLRSLRNRGYEWVPEASELEPGERISDLEIDDPHGVAALMKHRLPWPDIEKVLKDVPGYFRWDPTTQDPGEPPTPDEADGWRENRALGGPEITDERHGGDTEEVCGSDLWRRSPASSTCLTN